MDSGGRTGVCGECHNQRVRRGSLTGWHLVLNWRNTEGGPWITLSAPFTIDALTLSACGGGGEGHLQWRHRGTKSSAP